MKIGKITAGGYADQTQASGHLILPVGTNLNRPTDPQDGMLRYNNSSGGIEGFSRGWWSNLLTTSEFQIPGVELDEDENVTIASLAILLSQFQRTVTGGVDMIGPTAAHDGVDGEVVPLPGTLDGDFSYIDGFTPTRGTINGYKDTAGKGPSYLAVTGEYITPRTGSAWNIGGGYTSAMCGNTFQMIIDPYKSTGFPEEDRFDYLLDFFACIYNADWRASGYTVVGGDTYITPAWNLLDPYNDPNYGQLLLTVNLRNGANVHGYTSKQAQRNKLFAKWYVKFVKFRNFKLKSSPGFTPGGGSSPMPVDPVTGQDSPDPITIKGDVKRLIVKDYLMRKYPTWNASRPVYVTVHVESGNALYNDVNSAPALDGTQLPAGSLLKIKNDGYIIGGGGVGGSGSGWTVDGATATITTTTPGDGGNGGVGIMLDSNTTTVIDNSAGTIAGGGGGGGGGASWNIFNGSTVYAAGGGGGSGGALNLNTSENTYGQGREYTLAGLTPVITPRGWDSDRGTSGSIRTGSGLVATAGGTGGAGGEFIVDDVSGGTGGAGGSIGEYGNPGQSLTDRPNISIIGWTRDPNGSGAYLSHNDTIEVDGNKVKFVTHAPSQPDEYQFDDVDLTNNNITWLNGLVATGILDSTKYDIHTFEDVTGTGIGRIMDPTGGIYAWRELVLGLVIVSKTGGSSAETWVNNIHSQNSSCINIQPTGASSGENGGAGGAPGNSIRGGVVQYGTVDPATGDYTIDPTKNGTIYGPIG